MDVQSFPSDPANVPIIHSQASQPPILSPIDVNVPVPPKLPTTTANILVPLSPHIGFNYGWEARRPPSVYDATLALADLRMLLKSRNSRIHSDIILRTQLDHLDWFLAIYATGREWIKAAEYTTAILGQDVSCSRRLRAWGKNFIHDRSALPYHNHANSGCGSLLDNIDFVEELLAHIAKIGTHVSSQAIIDFLKKPEVVERYHVVNPAVLNTARKWMSKLNFAWCEPPKGTYLNGHKRPDVVHYRQNIFLPALAQLEPKIQAWDKDNLTHLVVPSSSPSPTRPSVLWFHDQCIFYQNDRRKCCWVHVSEKPVPLLKGEGVSLMVSDFISADYGWLRSPDGTDSARVLFRPGAN